MRVHLTAAAICIVALMGQVAPVAAQEPAPEAAPAAAAPEPAPTPAPISDPGVMAPIYDPPEPAPPEASATPPRRRAYAPSKPVAVAAAAQPVEAVVAPLIEAPTLAHQLTIIRAEEAHLDVLGGKSGPFVQAIAAWRVKDWYHFAFAMATLATWGVILAIVAGIVATVVRRRREAAR